MQTIVWTSANRSIEPMLLQWVISLRTLGKYSGKILILDYGLSNKYKNLYIAYDADLIPTIEKGPIVNHRFIDIIPILKQYDSTTAVAHFDADIWFQDDINDLFNKIPKNSQGCLFSPDVTWYTQNYLGLQSHFSTEYMYKIQQIKNTYEGTIQGGLSAGLNENLLNKYTLFDTLLKNKFMKDEYGADQFFFNWTFDTKIDSASAYLYNCIGSDIVCSDGVWFSKKYNHLNKCIGIHLVGMLRHEPFRYFKYHHTSLLLESCKQKNIPIYTNQNATNICIPITSIIQNNSVILQLEKIIELCSQYINNSITIGFSSDDMILSTSPVGCIDLVPWEHGNMHYWDRLNLPRRQHIAHPHKIFFSSDAVKSIAKIPKIYPSQLCAKFEYHWLDFMLSMMLVEHNISYDLII